MAQSVRVFDRQFGVMMPSWTRSLGIYLIIAGAVIALICIGVFVHFGKGTPAVFDPPTKFVAVGPYAYVRNPMYLGGFILLVGFGLYQTSISILILSVILLGLFHLFVVFYEGPNLEKLFGESYIEYKKRINRWIPKCRIKAGDDFESEIK